MRSLMVLNNACASASLPREATTKTTSVSPTPSAKTSERSFTLIDDHHATHVTSPVSAVTTSGRLTTCSSHRCCGRARRHEAGPHLWGSTYSPNRALTVYMLRRSEL